MGVPDPKAWVANVERLLDDEYGPGSFAEFASNRLGVEFEAGEFSNSTFEEAAQLSKDRASRNILSFIQEAIDENLPSDVEESEWQWQEMARQVSARYELKLTDRDLKRIGRDNLVQAISEQAEAQVQAVDLSDGKKYLESDWGVRSVCDWARLKFQLKIAPEELAGKTSEEVQEILKQAGFRSIIPQSAETIA